MNIPDRLLFGQYLLEEKIVDRNTLNKAIEIQYRENIADHPRMLGNILLHDFAVFRDRIDLRRCLVAFEEYKTMMDNMYLEAKIHGASLEDKLDDEIASLMEELDTPKTIKLKDIIDKIEKFRISIKQLKAKDDLIEELRKDNEAKEKEIKRLRFMLDDFYNKPYDFKDIKGKMNL